MLFRSTHGDIVRKRIRSKAIMFERILQEIHKGRNLVIDNEKIPKAIDSALLMDDLPVKSSVPLQNMK